MSNQGLTAGIALSGAALNLTQWALSMRAFRRNKVPASSKVLAAALCNSGYSYREVADIVGGISYIAVRDSFRALVTSLPSEAKSYRRAIAIDGSDVLVGGKTVHLWLARDIDSGDILEFAASPGALAEDGAKFLSKVAAQCSNKPFVKLGMGQGAPQGLLNLDLYFQNTPTQSLIGRIGRMILRSQDRE